MDEFNTHDISVLRTFCENYKSKYKIIIMGERYVENNVEVRQHKIVSLYEILMSMKNNNDILDLTHNILYDNDDFELFVNEIEIMNKARFNITFGWGGSFVITNAFSRNNICYVSSIKHEILNRMMNTNDKIYREFNTFLDSIKLLSSM